MGNTNCMDEPFTAIPNRLLRSAKLDVYDKLIYMLISSCCPSFPSYTMLMHWTGIAKRNRISKSLKNLEEIGLIKRYLSGRKIYYETHFGSNPKLPKYAQPVTYGYRNGNPGEPLSVTQGNSKKNKEKEQIKIGDEPSVLRSETQESIDNVFRPILKAVP